MTIPSITPLATIARTDTDFVAKVDALFSTLLSLFITEENAAIAATNIATADVTAKQLLAAASALAAGQVCAVRRRRVAKRCHRDRGHSC